MSVQPARVLFGLLALSLGWLLVACATKEDLRSTSQDLQNELKDARQRSAELETSLREIKGQDLSQILGQLETQRRDIDALLSGLDDQKAQVYSLDQKLAAQATRLQEVFAAVEKVRDIGTKLSAQVDQQAGTLGKLEAASNRFQGVLSEFDKVLRALNDKGADVDRRVTELTGRTEVKVGTLAAQQGDQAVKLEALEKVVAATVAAVNETSRGLGELKRVVEEAVGKQAAGVEVPETGVPAAKDSSSGTAQAAAPSAPSDKEAYDRAHQQYSEGRYDIALASFRSFLTQYPGSPLTPNAHFWLAECYVRARDYERGLAEYERVVKNYPKSAKAAPALYRKAMAFLELRNKEAAKSALRQLIADYPQSEDSQRAKAKLASLK